MKLRDMLEMLSRHDGDLRVTIGGEEYEGGSARVDRNGLVSLELMPDCDSLLKRIEKLEQQAREADRLAGEIENDAAGLEYDVKLLREENDGLRKELEKAKENLERAIRLSIGW